MEDGDLPEVSTASPRHQLIADIVRALFAQCTDSQQLQVAVMDTVFSNCARNFPKEWLPDNPNSTGWQSYVSFLYPHML
jgi:hypothetical protein